MELVLVVIALAIGIGAGIPLGIKLKEKKDRERLASVEEKAKELLDKAKEEAERLRQEAKIEAREEAYRYKEKIDQEYEERQRKLAEQEKRLLEQESRLSEKESSLERRSEQIERRAEELDRKEKALKQHEVELEQEKQKIKALAEAQQKELEKIAQLTHEEAKEIVLKKAEEEAREEAARMLVRIETEAKEEANRRAREILALAISRCATEMVTEKAVSVVPLPSEDMKGRIIGREGRNIRALEAATGVDLIIDDTPEVVVLSGFNPLRREVARIALERLISDGRIHPARIEEVVKKVEEELDVTIKEIGERAAFDVGVYGLSPELLRLLGKLKYRTSYSQNVLQHSIEVAYLCGVMAGELGLDVKKAKRAGLLHDIGKAVDQEMEGPHALIGAELAKKYGEDEEIVNAIAAHHEDVPPESILAILVQAADAVSGARPGARKELLESYIKRLETLEKVATSFPGVQKAYAIQAGREIRVIVDSHKIGDAEAVHLSRDIAKKIEKELTYPGQIKVTVIRETRAVEYAR
ncbi:metal dependent phosphohydrolase [Thermodesulfatator indicus DSM 15286]|uniref:Ribonuclease Y n=1 Tax=Thermodesulfatator indicus (strain DSM 15286 / JCM 11887 / CIR29812) TaxID=667014 RepID=F8A8P4_THEID|nr:ribonuclease Y [Thermodesulfatator indicus]AEH45135.1 metal dependent phosphohydrolase [Thermodesulfatator indicus DSM 15286]